MTTKRDFKNLRKVFCALVKPHELPTAPKRYKGIRQNGANIVRHWHNELEDLNAYNLGGYVENYDIALDEHEYTCYLAMLAYISEHNF